MVSTANIPLSSQSATVADAANSAAKINTFVRSLALYSAGEASACMTFMFPSEWISAESYERLKSLSSVLNC